jgi:exodeoxyribonuclease VII large subunit
MIAEARRRLEADGILARPRRRIPLLPKAIGVVCGHEAAVRADIESVVVARFPGYPVLFWETTVSGPGAVDNIVAAVAELDVSDEVEVIILARGGGDATALLPFSDEALCRAVAASATPVVAAIGHDGDRPLVDEVADLRCGTPSLAAGAVVPDRAALVARLDLLAASAAEATVARLRSADAALGAIDRDQAALAGLDRAAARLSRAAAQRSLVHPARDLARAGTRLAAIDVRSAAVTRLASSSGALAALHAQVEALSPVRVLERGYAVVRTASGDVVRDPAQVRGGDRVGLTLARGTVSAVVEPAR